MREIERRWIIIGSAVVAGLVVFVIGFAIGRSTSGFVPAAGAGSIVSDGNDATSPTNAVGDPSAATIPPQDVPAGGIPEYGTVEGRSSLVTALTVAGAAGGTRDEILTTADEVCFHLERLEAQGRSPAFAVRVVWNESLAQLPSTHIAAFAAVFVAGPRFLCPDSIGYAGDVAYWLGF